MNIRGIKHISTTRVIYLVVALLMLTLSIGDAVGVYALTEEDRQHLSRPFYSEFIDEDCTTGTGGPANIEVDKGFSLGSGPVERRVNLVQALMNDYGLSAAQAAGIVGNFMEEAGGKHLPPNVNQGGAEGPPRFSGGYGWAQWTGGRQRTFIDFAVAEGYMASEQVSANDAANYAYLKHELATGYTSTIEEIKGATTPEDAAASFHGTFERSGDNASQLAERGDSARQVFNEHQDQGGASGGSEQATSCGNEDGAAIAGDTAFPLLVSKSGIQNNEIFANNDTSLGGHPYTAYDILVAPGTPVVAFVGGTVTRVTEDRCPGRMISLYNAGANITVSYLHLAFSNHVAEGDTVAIGERVGVVGPASAGCGVPHLHIDAATGNTRPGCSRLNCPPENSSRFVSIGPQLFQTYQLLAD